MFSNKVFDFWKMRVASGDKNIALSNIGHIALQQKYILLLLSFLRDSEEFRGKKVAMVSFSFEQGLYRDFIEPSFLPEIRRTMLIPNQTGSAFINWDVLIYKNIPAEFLESYDLILWDLPDLNFININSHSLQRFFREFHSMLILTNRPNRIDSKEYINRIYNFYSGHGL